MVLGISTKTSWAFQYTVQTTFSNKVSAVWLYSSDKSADLYAAFVRKVITITTLQFILLSMMIFFIVQICPLFEWLKNR